MKATSSCSAAIHFLTQAPTPQSPEPSVAVHCPRPRDQIVATRTTFSGFQKETLRFLINLRTNNTKQWFDAHRSDYDDYYVEPAKSFVEAIGPRLSRLSAGLKAEPRINGSIFRINRDVRFSRDKTPYKHYLDFAFWEGEKKASGSSLFLRISPDGMIIGSGFHQGCPAQLKAFRTAVADPKSGKQLAELASRLRGKGLKVQGSHFKRRPRGFMDDGPALEFLLHDSLYVMHNDRKERACEKDFISTCIRHWRTGMPLHCWLIDHTGTRMK